MVFAFFQEEIRSEEKHSTRARKEQEGESTDPVQVIRKGAIAASIWKRQSTSGYAYYDFSLLACSGRWLAKSPINLEA